MRETIPYDLVIHNACCLPLTGEDLYWAQGYVAVRDGRIAACGPQPPAGLPPARSYYDARGNLLLPGLVNCHCHAAMSLFRGLADDLPLMTWLEHYIFPAERRWVDDQLVYYGTLLAAAEMIRGGITTVADAYFHAAAARRALAEAGLRAVVAQGVIDCPAPGVPEPAVNLQVAAAFLEEGEEFPPGLSTSTVFCHSPYTCGAATLQGAKALAAHWQRPFFLHLAETREEVELSRRRTGLTPVRYLDRLGLLDAQTVAVHAVWLTPEDQELLAARQVKVCHCPESNLKLAAGVAPIAALRRRGVTVGLGTDGPASNNNLDLFGEMSLAARLQKVYGQDPTLLPAREVVAMATCEGAAVLGLAGKIGSLAPGKEADLIILDLQQPHLTPLYDPYSQLVYAARAADVQAVMVQGRWLLRERRLQTLDWPALKKEVAALAARIAAAGLPPASGGVVDNQQEDW